MKLVVSSTALGAATTMLAKVINTKNALPILGDILFEVKGKELTLLASDSETTLRTTIEIEESDGDGRFCVSANKLKEALAEISEQPITLTATTETTMMLTVEHQSGEFHFPIENADEYPKFEVLSCEAPLVMDGNLLADAIKRSQFAMANDELRPIMCSIFFRLTHGYVDIVASNGSVLSKSQIHINCIDAEDNLSMIIPRKAVSILNSMPLTIGDATIITSERNADITCCGYTLGFRQIEGKYPNYNSVIPEDQPLTAKISRAWLVSAIRKVAPFANDSSNMIVMDFTKNKLRVSGDDFDLSMGATDELNIEYDKEPITIGVKASQLLKALAQLPGQELYWNMTDPSHAITFEPCEQPDDVEITMLTMPMLVND